MYISPDYMSSEDAWRARPFDIDVDGKAVSVGTNLYTALIALRSHVTLQNHPACNNKAQSTGCFWIDALCINQTNLKEKNIQVMMMSRIYRQASLVFAWLGGGDLLSRQTLYDLAAIAELPTKERGLKTEDLVGMDIKSDETYQKLGIPKLGYSSWVGIYVFFNRAWFKRAWIVQEITLAQEPWFICGRQLFSVDVVLQSLEVLHQSRWFQQLRELTEPLIMNFRSQLEFRSSTTQSRSSVRLYRPRLTNLINTNLGFMMRDVRVSLGTSEGVAVGGGSPRRPSLITLLDWYRFTEAGDPKDKIYALIGISREEETNPLKVDYRLTVEEVYTQTAKHLIDSSKSLAVLSLAKLDPEISSSLSLPSWVPNFAAQIISSPINTQGLFTASLGIGQSEFIYLQDDKLQLSGIKVATVGDKLAFSWMKLIELCHLLRGVSTLRVLGDENFGLNNPPGACRTTVGETSSHQSSRRYRWQSPFESLWRTLLLDSYGDKHPAPMECNDLFITIFQQAITSAQLHVAYCLKYPQQLSSLQAAAKQSTRTETGGQYSDRFFDVESVKEQLGLMYTALQEMLGNLPSTESGLLFPPEYLEFDRRRKEAESESDEHEIIANFHNEIGRKVATPNSEVDFRVTAVKSGRSLFTTNEGHLGIGENGLEPGDEVWVLAGGNVPFLMRRTLRPGEFRFVGEAYIHGIMHGESVANISVDEIQIITLI